MIRMLIVFVAGCLFAITPVYAADKPVKVFILAGQSNQMPMKDWWSVGKIPFQPIPGSSGPRTSQT